MFASRRNNCSLKISESIQRSLVFRADFFARTEKIATLAGGLAEAVFRFYRQNQEFHDWHRLC
jgi:hypothetical protein